MQVKDPHKMTLPGRQGELVVSFVDLTPVPPTAIAMSAPRFAALRSIVINSRVRPRHLINSSAVATPFVSCEALGSPPMVPPAA